MECLELLQNLGQAKGMSDWKVVLMCYDQQWISQKDYNNYFKKAGVEVFV
jgi:hypothetical protein